MFKRLLGVSIIFGMAATAPPALAASCGVREDVIYQLENKYSEKLTSGGLQTAPAENSMVEIWSSDQTGTFTVLMTQANGISCIVAVGTDYFDVGPTKRPKGTAS
ncbi:hypothetical protein [Parasedimentitalea huanghaiensis]|uniref:Lipoprotein n=1 Tax=Parasedimentitalea huanghaiensis TaxID=2682100 RepID=A0A6L6WLH1_9RHOB|nr:hypothetical protein [Zongyanglinia huanghaiensis]MVO17849.1 hypothetical protein [Zongyanglinia huanghaiensis]